MQKALLYKTIIVVVLMLAIGVPLAMIQSTISERIAFRKEAVRSIAADSVREQTLIGPIVVIPYIHSYETQEEVADGTSTKRKTVKHTLNRRMLVYPKDLQITGGIETDQRYRGIHKVLIYNGQYSMRGNFVLPKQSDLPRDQADSRITLGTPYLALAIDDVRGIRSSPKLDWNGKPIEFIQGSGLVAFKSGVHAPLGPLDFPKELVTVDFKLELGLDGIERQHFVPIGKNNLITLESKWPHPQFGGRFLPSPKTRKITDSGFNASWAISGLATDAQRQVTMLDQAPSGNEVAGDAHLQKVDRFHVAFIEPVNIYSASNRAIKYGLLFVMLTFTAFFLFEILKRLPIHPVQYSLVGLALALFFLLLVSLSEHVAFLYAYLIASGGCVALIAFYLSYVLRNWRRGLSFGAGLALLYGTLYGLLHSENNALALGSLMLFVVLSAVMVATRKVDWYKIGKAADA